MALRVPSCFIKEAVPLQLVSHLTDYLLHEKFQSGFRPGPGPEPSVNRVFYNLLIVIQKPIKPGLYLAFGTVGQ